MTPYSNRDLGQHWPRQWLVAWRHQAITWTNVDQRLLASIPVQFHSKCTRYIGKNFHWNWNILVFLCICQGPVNISRITNSMSENIQLLPRMIRVAVTHPRWRKYREHLELDAAAVGRGRRNSRSCFRCSCWSAFRRTCNTVKRV